MTRFNVFLRKDQIAALAAIGERTGRSRSDLVRHGLDLILDEFGVPEGNRTWRFEGETGAALLDALPRGHEIAVPPVLFAKIEDSQIAAWTERFGGGAGA